MRRVDLVLGDLGEDVHHDVQAGVDESLLQLLVLGSSVVHLVVLPLLKPLVVGEGDQTQRGLSWSAEGNAHFRPNRAVLTTPSSAPPPVSVPGDLSSQVGSLAEGEATKSSGIFRADSSLFPFMYFSTLLKKAQHITNDIYPSTCKTEAGGPPLKKNSQLVKVVLTEDPVVVGLQAQFLLGSVQANKHTESTLTMLHHLQLLLDA